MSSFDDRDRLSEAAKDAAHQLTGDRRNRDCALPIRRAGRSGRFVPDAVDDKQGRIRLSMKAVAKEEEGAT